MKFRYKVLFINIILLSAIIGTVGFLMIDKNFSLALESQIKNAVEENNIIQSSVEYELLNLLNSDSKNLATHLADIGTDLTVNMAANQSDIYILYDGSLLYPGVKGVFPYPELWQNTEMGEKNYIIVEEDERQYIYTVSCNIVFNKNLNIINRRDITDIFLLLEKQKQYFLILLIFAVLFCSVCLFIISHLLTKPLETLNRVSLSFGQGDYEARAKINTRDEIGALAKTYNDMAQSVSDHVNELQDMLLRQEQFVADFTHEIKTPMTSIIGYADTIRSKSMSQENLILAASYIFHEGKRLEDMSMKLFDLIYTKKHEIELIPLVTAKLIEEVSISVTPSLKANHITLTTDFVNCKIDGEINLLKTAFINLIDNARKASSPDSKIIFHGEITKDGYRIYVKDFGIGIDKEHLSHICDEFYMVDKSRSRQEGGAGLGLSLAALIFKSHNATMDIESTLGMGTTVYVTFPHFEEIQAPEEEIKNATE